jgi:hypothetical protein
MYLGAETPWVPQEPVLGTYWRELTEVQADKLVTKHGGGDDLVVVEPTSGPAFPEPPGAWSWQLFRAADGFEILLVHDGAGLEHFYVLDTVGPGTMYPALKEGLRWWQYAIIGGVGAGAGALILHPRVRRPVGAAIGAGVTMGGAALTMAMMRKFGQVVEENIQVPL